MRGSVDLDTFLAPDGAETTVGGPKVDAAFTVGFSDSAVATERATPRPHKKFSPHFHDCVVQYFHTSKIIRHNVCLIDAKLKLESVYGQGPEGFDRRSLQFLKERNI